MKIKYNFDEAFIRTSNNLLTILIIERYPGFLLLANATTIENLLLGNALLKLEENNAN